MLTITKYNCRWKYARYSTVTLLYGRKKICFFKGYLYIDIEFIDDAIENVKPLIKLAILSELVGKWFTRQNIAPLSEATKDQWNPSEGCTSTKVWCYCKKGEDYGDMIGCDNNNSKFSGFTYHVYN